MTFKATVSTFFENSFQRNFEVPYRDLLEWQTKEELSTASLVDQTVKPVERAGMLH
jgi:hypothetical protein